jgi:hypothetical protein
MFDMLISFLAVVGGVTGVIAGLRYVAKKTKTPYDDVVVNILEDLAPVIADKVAAHKAKEQAVQAVPAPKRESKRDCPAIAWTTPSGRPRSSSTGPCSMWNSR